MCFLKYNLEKLIDLRPVKSNNIKDTQIKEAALGKTLTMISLILKYNEKLKEAEK